MSEYNTEIFQYPNPKPSQGLAGNKSKAPPSNGESGRKAGIRLSSIDFIQPNPLDTFWRLAIAEGYDKEQISPRELHITVPGLWCEHHIALNWSAANEDLQLFLAFDSHMPGGRSDKVCRLMSLLNERLSVGHFEFWEKDSALVFRHSINLSGAARLTSDQAIAMIAGACEAADRGYPACQYMIWAGLNPQDALEKALMERAARASSQMREL